MRRRALGSVDSSAVADIYGFERLAGRSKAVFVRARRFACKSVGRDAAWIV